MEFKPSNPMDLITEASEQWLEACLQPWSVLSSVNRYWGEQWKRWLSTIALAPNPWLPALAEDRDGQPAMIDFFLPWLPRAGARMTPPGPGGDDAAVRAMLRAAAPHVGVSTELRTASEATPGSSAKPLAKSAPTKAPQAPASRGASATAQEGKAVAKATAKVAKPKSAAAAARKAKVGASAGTPAATPAPEKSAE